MKYFNKKVEIDNIKFASKKEIRRYTELKWLERAGLIKELELQKAFELQPNITTMKNKNILLKTQKGLKQMCTN